MYDVLSDNSLSREKVVVLYMVQYMKNATNSHETNEKQKLKTEVQIQHTFSTPHS